MKNLIFLIVIFITTLCSAQIDFVKHHKTSVQAQRALDAKDYSKALQYFETAFAINGAIKPVDYLNAAVCEAQLENEKGCEKWISMSIEKEKLEKESILKYSENPLYKKCAEQIIMKYDALIEQFYENRPNKSVYFNVEKLLNRDQFSRKLANYYMGISEEQKENAFEQYLKSQKNGDTAVMKKYKAILFPKVAKDLETFETKIIKYTDSLNIREFMNITEEFGYQKEGWLLLWHQRGSYGEDNWIWNYFKPLIDNEIKKGKITPSFWAMFEDITSIRKTGKSIYGYHPGKVDPHNVNRKRQEIGLPALTEEEINDRNNNPYGGSIF